MATSNKIFLYYHTLKHLKPKQITYRLLYKIPKKKFYPKLLNRRDCLYFNYFELYQQKHFEGYSFDFLNKKIPLNEINNNIDIEKLWLYNFHYFDDLISEGCENRIDLNYDLIKKWINSYDQGCENAWEPYPCSLRIVNWIKASLTYFNHKDDDIYLSLSEQVEFLYRNIEYHILGNHLFTNAKALIFGGAFFSGLEADKWLKKGLSILDEEIYEQVLDDGFFFELSPMYHNIVLMDMLDLYNLSLAYEIPELVSRRDYWSSIIVKMLNASELMSHPDNEVSFFNDSAIGIAPNYKKLNQYAYQLGVDSNANASHLSSKCTYLEDSGYVIVNDFNVKAILDVAKVGPDYIPGHAHADTLSFEMSFFKHRVFVNSGTSLYGTSAKRLNQRKTRSHNTIEVDGYDSSEVWGGFRVARRAMPSKPKLVQENNVIEIACSHDGYNRLDGNVTHHRSWSFDRNLITISDKIEGVFSNAIAYFHIHPSVVVIKDNNKIKMVLPTGQTIFFECCSDVNIIDDFWSPEFGIDIPNKTIVVSLSKSKLNINIRY
ncbi:MAG: heparinase [Vibrionaceae bacterium]|nr:heparinase [Vibrionaceae bacterium]